MSINVVAKLQQSKLAFANLMNEYVESFVFGINYQPDTVAKMNALYFAIEAMEFQFNKGLGYDNETTQQLYAILDILTPIYDEPIELDPTLLYPNVENPIIVYGPQGPQGPQGAQGFQGNIGPQGFQGAQGATGPQGTQGQQGFQGSIGPQGFQGTQGVQGFQGEVGPQGTQGTQGFQGFQGTQGNQGATGLQGVQGPQGFQGTQGDVGSQGIQGPQGFQGNQGVQGFQGTQGFQGFQGAVGPQGFQGSTGAQGSQGPQGDTGAQGFQGTQGFQGPQGFQGTQGVQGFQGPQGFQGQGYNGLTSITSVTIGTGSKTFTVNKIPSTTSFQIGDRIRVSNSSNPAIDYMDGSIVSYSGTTLVVNVTNTGGTGTSNTWNIGITGAQGIQGAQGVQGFQGSVGPQGTQGFQGATGAQGSTGAQGFQGPTGATGDQGSTGAQGVQGTQGFQGATGATGAQGSTGPQGATGAQGATGTQGVQGIQGPQGFQGQTGATGTQGVQGVQGPQGFQGFQGPQGLDGGMLTSSTYLVQGKLATDQSIANGSDIVIAFVDDFDPKNWWDATTKRFTPTAAGYYSITLEVNWSAGSAAIYQYNTQIRKNGSSFSIAQNQITTTVQLTQTTNKLVYLNGTTDYVDFTAYNGDVSARSLIGGNATWFSATLIAYGPQGFQGVQGATGAQGATGVQGATGAQGAQGTQGFQGIQGPVGVGYDNFTSTSSITVGTSVKAFTTNKSVGQTAFAVGQRVRVTYPADSTIFMEGSIVGFSANTLLVDVTNTSGSGTQSSWVISITGLQGVQGAQGTTGVQGSTGAQGVQGAIGPQGSTGTQGSTGPQGATGAQGVQGVQGVQGPQGFQGTQGIGYYGLTSATTTTVGTGSKTFTTNLGSTQSAFTIGQRVRISYTVSPATTYMEGTITAFNTTSVTVNVDYALGAGTVSSWTFEVAGLQGPQGVQGFQGTQGATGAQGSTGPQGAIGPQGFQGTQGATGATGVQGATGAQGVQGPQGFQGTQGPGVSGTINYLAKFTSGTAIGNSQIFDNGTNVGIGTTSPSVSLQVTTPKFTAPTLRLEQTGWRAWDIFVDAANNDPALIFKDASAALERMRITSGGNVGIGTTSPGYALSISRGAGSGLNRVQLSPGTDYSFYQIDNTAGQILIGTDNSTAAVFGSGNYSMNIYNSYSSDLNMWTNGTLRIKATSGGNIQIGSASAFSNATKLQVTGDICVSSGSRMYFDSSAATLSIKSSSSGAGGAMQFFAGGSADANIAIQIASDKTVALYNVFNRQTASYTLVLGDAGKIVEMNVASANNLTVPLNSSVAYPIGTEIQVLQYGAGQTTIVATSGVTLRSKSGQLKIGNQYTGITLVKVGTDEWYVVGNVSA